MSGPVDWPTADLLAHRADATPDRTALVDADGGTALSYRELDGRVEAVAGALGQRGVEPGDRVGMLRGNGVGVVELVHAVARLRATLVPLNVELTADELRPRIEGAALDWLVCEASTESAATAVFDPGATLSADEPTAEGVERIGRSTAPLPERPPLGRDRTVVVMFTSGTTGAPKGVRLTAGNLVASATASAFRLGVSRGDRWLVCLPTYHMGGLAPVVRSALYGTTAVLQGSFDAGDTAAVVADEDVTGVSLVPTMLARLLDDGWTPPDHLRVVLLGGAPASTALIARCERADVPVYPTYGTTETASQVATATPEAAFAHEGTVGQPLVTTAVTVVDEDGDPLGPRETGELVVAGPTVTPGYLDDDRTDAAFGPHGLHTGDVGYRDEVGRLWVVGRTDDTVVTGGENVHPAEVAAAIRAHPGVEDVAVVGLPDHEWGERLAALVVGDVEVDAIEVHVRDRLAGFKVPKTWCVADAIPRTPSGTVDRAAVRERLEER